VKAHYSDPLGALFHLPLKVYFVKIPQNVAHLILSLNFGVLVFFILFSYNYLMLFEKIKKIK
jgi:hypothetical protein